MNDEGIYKLSSVGDIAGGTVGKRFANFGTDYGDFGALQRIAYTKLSAAGGFSFPNIPQNYQDLFLVINSRNDSSTSPDFGIKLNNNQSVTATWTPINGNGSLPSSVRSSNIYGFATVAYSIPSNAATGMFASAFVWFPNYANSAYNKVALARSANDQNGSGNVTLTAASWPITSAISQLDFLAYGGTNFAAGSTATLYGIKASAA